MPIDRVKYTLTLANNELAQEFHDKLVRNQAIGNRQIDLNNNIIEFIIPRNLVRTFEILRKMTHRDQYKAQRVPMTTVSEYIG